MGRLDRNEERTRLGSMAFSMENGYLTGYWDFFAIVDNNGNTLAQTRMRGNPHEFAEEAYAILRGGPSRQLRRLFDVALGRGLKRIFVEDPSLVGALNNVGVIEVLAGQPSAFRDIRPRSLGMNNVPVHALAISLAEKTLNSVLSSDEQALFRLVQELERIEYSQRLFANLLRQWSVYHFPALPKTKQNDQEFLRQLVRLTQTASGDHGGRRSPRIMTGSYLRLETQVLAEAAGIGLRMGKLRTRIIAAIDETIRAVAPNLQSLLGPALAARLLLRAGGLHALASMPAGRIQLKGARWMSSPAKTPKYGLIYSHELVTRLPAANRAKMARSLSCLIPIAARADFFSRRNITNQLIERAKKRFRELGGRF